MAREGSASDFWALQPSELRRECRAIAQAPNLAVDAMLRAEANRLAAEWQETIDMPLDNSFTESRKAAQIAALRKRTIEILVRMSGSNQGHPAN